MHTGYSGHLAGTVFIATETATGTGRVLSLGAVIAASFRPRGTRDTGRRSQSLGRLLLRRVLPVLLLDPSLPEQGLLLPRGAAVAAKIAAIAADIVRRLRDMDDRYLLGLAELLLRVVVTGTVEVVVEIESQLLERVPPAGSVCTLMGQAADGGLILQTAFNVTEDQLRSRSAGAENLLGSRGAGTDDQFGSGSTQAASHLLRFHRALLQLPALLLDLLHLKIDLIIKYWCQ